MQKIHEVPPLQLQAGASLQSQQAVAARGRLQQILRDKLPSIPCCQEMTVLVAFCMHCRCALLTLLCGFREGPSK